jgi:hypothetical protein
MATIGRTTRTGFIVGLFAYASVALFYSIFDFLAARGTLYTVNLLGRSVFGGLRDAGVLHLPVRLEPLAIIAYNGLHLALSLAIGLVVVRLVAHAERDPAHARLMLSIIVLGFFGTILAVGLISAPIRPVLPWWSIVVANTLAVGVAAVYLVRTHPGLGRRLLRPGH